MSLTRQRDLWIYSQTHDVPVEFSRFWISTLTWSVECTTCTFGETTRPVRVAVVITGTASLLARQSAGGRYTQSSHALTHAHTQQYITGPSNLKEVPQHDTTQVHLGGHLRVSENEREHGAQAKLWHLAGRG